VQYNSCNLVLKRRALLTILQLFSLPARTISNYRRALLSRQYAAERGLPGLIFFDFARSLAPKLALHANREFYSYLVNPVSCVRYFEFDFARRWFPPSAVSYLDVGSPRLFGLYIASTSPGLNVRMINPDGTDAKGSKKQAAALGLPNLSIDCCGVDAVAQAGEQYDCVCSISVIEHISGRYSDREAIGMMWDAVRPGGRLILTFPVDREFLEEYRTADVYGLGAPQRGDEYFFQRRYDLKAIHDRLLDNVGAYQRVDFSWFGERRAGFWREYEARWTREGRGYVVDDPRLMVDNFAEFSSWEEMPGTGICGMAICKDPVGGAGE